MSLISLLSSLSVGNLDERVSDRVLYDILIQAGRVVDLHIPRDKDTGKPKGFAFAVYESEEIANYAVKLFSGLVSLHSRILKFAVCFLSQCKFVMVSLVSFVLIFLDQLCFLTSKYCLIYFMIQNSCHIPSFLVWRILIINSLLDIYHLSFNMCICNSSFLDFI